MYNWRLLLLAFFAVFQPIASFTERNLVDGRQQCCDHRLSRDPTYSLYGDNRFKFESSRKNDQRREIRHVRPDERRNKNIPVSLSAIATFRDSYREREIRETPELRTRLSRDELRRERESEQSSRNLGVTDTFSNRIRSTENRRDNRFRVIRKLQTRNVDGNLDQRNLERLTIDSRRENRLTRDNVDEVRRIRNIRDTREEIRRTRDNIIRSDRFRALDNQHIQQDESLDRQVTRFVLRNQRSVRSLDRLSRGSEDDRRLSFENLRIIKQEHVNRDVRARERDDIRIEAERRNILIRVTEGDREYGSRFSKTRHVLKTQRSVRSLDRLSRGSNDDRRLFFENIRIVKIERESYDVRAQDRDEIRNEVEWRDMEIRDRERPEVEQEIGSRFSTIRNVVFRNEGSVRFLDRLSRERNNDRRLSFENDRIAKQKRENRDASTNSRDVKAQERSNVRNEAERRNIEIRARERSEVDREIGSRFSLTRQVDNNRERRLSINSMRTNNKLKMSTNFGDRAHQIRRENKNNDGYQSYLRVSRERNDYDRRSVDFQFAARSRMDAARERTDDVQQMCNVREDSRDDYRDYIRDVSLKNRRAREIIGRRMSGSETRLSENSRARRSLNSRDREINAYVRIIDDKAVQKMQNEGVQLREISRYREEQSDEVRASRDKTIERRSIRERIISEQRDAREGPQRITEIRNSQFRDNGSRFRGTSESRLSSRVIEREFPLTHNNRLNIEQRKTCDIDERRDPIRNIITTTSERQNIDSRTKSNVDFLGNHINTLGQKRVENENRAYESNWQNQIYTMQGIYLCSILIPMLMSSNNDKKKVKFLSLWTPFQKSIKAD